MVHYREFLVGGRGEAHAEKYGSSDEQLDRSTKVWSSNQKAARNQTILSVGSCLQDSVLGQHRVGVLEKISSAIRIGSGKQLCVLSLITLHCN